MIPCYNEAENVLPMSEAILSQMDFLPGYDYEILFIDNCSTDGTREKLSAMCARNRKIKAIFNARNFGQFNSPFYGLQQTDGDCVISMCCDFQDPPEIIPELVAEWEKGYKIVCAVKTESEENKFVRFLRTGYYKFLRKFSEAEQIEHFTGTGLYDRSFIDVLRRLDDPLPFFRGIVAELGFQRAEVPYTQKKRRAGKSHNNFCTLYDAAMLSFTQYTKFPVRLMMGTGIGAGVLSVFGGIACVILAALGKNVLFPALLCGMGVLFSLSAVFMSLLGEYLLLIRSKVSRRPLVVEEKRINFGE